MATNIQDENGDPFSYLMDRLELLIGADALTPPLRQVPRICGAFPAASIPGPETELTPPCAVPE